MSPAPTKDSSRSASGKLERGISTPGKVSLRYPAEIKEKESLSSEQTFSFISGVIQSLPSERAALLANALTLQEAAYKKEKELLLHKPINSPAENAVTTISLLPIFSDVLESGSNYIEHKNRKANLELVDRISRGENYQQLAKEFPALALSIGQYGVDPRLIPAERRDLVCMRWLDAVKMMRIHGSTESYQAIYHVAKTMLSPAIAAELEEVRADKHFLNEVEKEVTVRIGSGPLAKLSVVEQQVIAASLRESMIFAESINRGESKLSSLKEPLRQIWEECEAALNLSGKILSLSDRGLKESAPAIAGVGLAALGAAFVTLEAAPFVTAGASALGSIAGNGTVIGSTIARPFATQWIRNLLVRLALGSISAGAFNTAAPVLTGENPFQDGGKDFLVRTAGMAALLATLGIVSEGAVAVAGQIGNKILPFIPASWRAPLGYAVLGGAVSAETAGIIKLDNEIHSFKGGSSDFRLRAQSQSGETVLSVALLIITSRLVSTFHPGMPPAEITKLAESIRQRLPVPKVTPQEGQVPEVSVAGGDSSTGVTGRGSDSQAATFNGGRGKRKKAKAAGNSDPSPGIITDGPPNFIPISERATLNNGASRPWPRSRVSEPDKEWGRVLVFDRSGDRPSTIVVAISRRDGRAYFFDIPGQTSQRLPVRAPEVRTSQVEMHYLQGTGDPSCITVSWVASLRGERLVVYGIGTESTPRNSIDLSAQLFPSVGGQPIKLSFANDHAEIAGAIKQIPQLVGTLRGKSVRLVGTENLVGGDEWAGLPIDTAAIGVYSMSAGGRILVRYARTGNLEVVGYLPESPYAQPQVLFRGGMHDELSNGQISPWTEPITIGKGGLNTLTVRPSRPISLGSNLPVYPWDVIHSSVDFRSDGVPRIVERLLQPRVPEAGGLRESVIFATDSPMATPAVSPDQYFAEARVTGMKGDYSSSGVYLGRRLLNSMLGLSPDEVGSIVIGHLDAETVLAGVIRNHGQGVRGNVDFYLTGKRRDGTGWEAHTIEVGVGKIADGTYNVRTGNGVVKLRYNSNQDNWELVREPQTKKGANGQANEQSRATALIAPNITDTPGILESVAAEHLSRVRKVVAINHSEHTSGVAEGDPHKVTLLAPQKAPQLFPALIRQIAVFKDPQTNVARVVTIGFDGRASIRTAKIDPRTGKLLDVESRISLGAPKWDRLAVQTSEKTLIWSDKEFEIRGAYSLNSKTKNWEFDFSLRKKNQESGDSNFEELPLAEKQLANSAIEAITREGKAEGAREIAATNRPIDIWHHYADEPGVFSVDKAELISSVASGIIKGGIEFRDEIDRSKNETWEESLPRATVVGVGSGLTATSGGLVLSYFLPSSSGRAGIASVILGGTLIPELLPGWIKEYVEGYFPRKKPASEELPKQTVKPVEIRKPGIAPLNGGANRNSVVVIKPR